jgi:uncharacterized protein YegL
MANIDELKKDLELYLDADDNSTEPEEQAVIEEGIKGNVTADDTRDNEQALLYMVIDKSGSMYNNGFEEGVRAGLQEVKTAVNGAKEVNCIQTAMTFFGSTLDMRPFQYGERIDTSYDANEPKTRLFDAVVESSKNMVSQYDKLKPNHKLKGIMMIFTDGEENGSEQYELKDVHKYLDELHKRGIIVLVAGFKEVDLEKLGKQFKTEPVEIKDAHQIRKYMKFVSNRVMG